VSSLARPDLRYFREDEVRRLAEPRQAIKAIRAAFARDLQGTLHMPLRTHLDLDGNLLLLMPCHDRAMRLAGVKTVTVGAQAGVSATYTLIDGGAGKILAFMEANYLTDLRTAATSAVVTELLSRADVKTLGIFGTGRQAFAHFAVLPLVRSFQRYLVCGSGRTDTSEFCERVKAELGIRLESVGAKTCISESEVICTCTTSSRPLFDGEWLRPGTHLNLIGAYQPSSREVDSKTIRRARVVVDTYDGCMAEAGDLLIPINEQAIDRSHILADLHELVAMKKLVRRNADDITLFKSVGCALEDLVVANLVYERSHA